MASKKVTTGLYVLLAAMGVANLLLVEQNLRMRRSLEATRPNRLEVGDKVPPFTAAGLNGEPLDIAYTGEGRDKLLFFYTPSCPYSRQQFPGWLDLAERADKGELEVLGLVADAEDKIKLREYLHEVSSAHPPGINFPTAVVSKEVRSKYKLSETPLTLLIANDGTVKEVWAGKWDSKVLASVNRAIGVSGD
jgi:AhpC/TSA family